MKLLSFFAALLLALVGSPQDHHPEDLARDYVGHLANESAVMPR